MTFELGQETWVCTVCRQVGGDGSGRTSYRFGRYSIEKYTFPSEVVVHPPPSFIDTKTWELGSQVQDSQVFSP